MLYIVYLVVVVSRAATLSSSDVLVVGPQGGPVPVTDAVTVVMLHHHWENSFRVGGCEKLSLFDTGPQSDADRSGGGLDLLMLTVYNNVLVRDGNESIIGLIHSIEAMGKGCT